MTILNLQVSANNDDAHEAQDGSDFEVAADRVKMNSSTSAGSRYVGGHRFTSVTIPKSATILSAILQLALIGSTTDDANVDIHAEDIDNAVDFAATADVNSRIRTTASVAWIGDDQGTGFQSSPDIKTVIQEIVDRGSWASGNALVILVVGKSDVFKVLQSTSHDQSAGFGAKLDIEYAAVRKRSYARAIL